MTSQPKTRCAGVFLAGGAVAVVLVMAWSWPKRVLPSEETASLNVTPRSVPMIPPGTVVADRAPKGWTHLILKSYPHVSRESLPKVSKTTAHMANLLFTVILAQVEGRRTAGGFERFRLAKVGVGVGTTVDGQDMVLTTATEVQLGAGLGWLDRRVLNGGEAELHRMSVVARSPSMAILDTPSYMLHGGEHIDMLIRYVLLLDSRTGRLDTLAWTLAEGRGADAVPLGPIEWLAPDFVRGCPLHVDPDEYVLGFPTKRAFAMYTPPPGYKQLDPPEETKRLAATVAPFRPEQAEALETQLRALVAEGQDP